MGDVVNLNQFRKAKKKAAKPAEAAIHRARFGRTKEEKARDEAEAARRRRDLDGVKQDEKDDPPG